MYDHDVARIATPIGIVVIIGDDEMVRSIAIVPDGQTCDAHTHPVREAARQLAQYFDGERTAFDLPLAPATTPRGAVLRDAMVAIPYGERETYGTVAHHVGSSARAIGGACRRNPLPIVVPCHRVLSAGATDYYSAGNGPETKQWLLAHERRHRSEAQ